VKTDRKGIPFRTFGDRFRSAEGRLFNAAEVGDVDLVLGLLATKKVRPQCGLKGGDSPMAEHVGRTPMHLASASGRFEVVEALLAAGASPDCATVYAETPLHQAASHGHMHILALLASHGGNLNRSALREFSGHSSARSPLDLADGKYDPAAHDVYRAARDRTLLDVSTARPPTPASSRRL
jgi:hypothetical protein